MFTTTLKDLRQAEACFEGYNKVVRMLQNKQFTEEDEARESYIRFAHKDPITLESVCNNNGLDDALWALRTIPTIERDCRLFAVWCARQVEHLSTDPRVKACNDVAESFANGMATDEDLDAARDAAESAARSARSAARSAAESAARSAESAAESAAWSAAWSAESAARSAESAAWSASRSAQKEMFIKMCNGNAPWQEYK